MVYTFFFQGTTYSLLCRENYHVVYLPTIIMILNRFFHFFLNIGKHKISALSAIFYRRG